VRPALEDMIGAGALVQAIRQADPARSESPEAAACAAVFASVAARLHATLADCVSGRQLHGLGLAADISWAAELDASGSVPILGEDGAFGALA